VELAPGFECPVLGLFGGADPGIPEESVAAFDSALEAAGVEHRLITYPEAPHSFFDRTAEAHSDAAADAWRQVLGFVGIQVPD
jgi:carboxymethylenebutenolidase